MNYLQEQLVQQKRLNFDLTRTSMEDLVQQLEILADTIYVKVNFSPDWFNPI